MPDQLTFDLPIKTAFGREDFFVTSSNSTAVKILENWTNWGKNNEKMWKLLQFSENI